MTAATELHTAKQSRFLARLAETGQVTRSCIEVGWDRVQAYRVKNRDPKFAELWEAALEAYADTLEAEAHRRAVTGTEKGIWHQGVQVGAEKQYSDSLLSQMLKAKRREYRDKVELGNADDKPFRTEDGNTVTAEARIIAHALLLGARAAGQGQVSTEQRSPDHGPDSAPGEDMA